MTLFPFTAIVGMEQAKKSLIYHAIDPRIGGTLFLGHRGCAKSTLVRAFAEILQSTSDARIPFVEVPLGATEDRLLGSVDAETLVKQNEWRGRSGLIEDANGGVLYIDEVNLLPDHLADFILDSAASGRYRMERDGITRIVESRYILVGTMNPEEGDLRPQLSDRFAHGVRIHDDFTPGERMEIVQRRIEFDDDPERVASDFAALTADLKNQIALARGRLKEVCISHELRMAVAAKGEMLKLEGIRAELAVVRTARCAAAWDNRSEVEERDLNEAWDLCLGHREPEPPHTPPSPPPNSQPGKFARNASTSPAPLDSRLDPARIGTPRVACSEPLRQWWKMRDEPHLAARDRAASGKLSEESRGAIAWVESLVLSARTGRLRDHSGIALRYRVPSAKRNLWCFLDASRSTGATRFLGPARDALAGLARSAKSARFHLLILEGGKIRWLARGATARRFASLLSRVTEASGKSLIVESLKILHRAKMKKGTASRDRLVIASDGLASPLGREKPDQVLLRLRHALRQIARAQSPIAWIRPPAGRGLARWLPAVVERLNVRSINV